MAVPILLNDNLKLVLTHLDMALYGERATRMAELEAQFGSNIPYLYHLFASVNLLVTLFLVDKGNEAMGGYIYRSLRREGLENHLEAIQRILQTPVGRTTFGDVIRLTRNKLMVHGDLDVASLPDEVGLMWQDHDAMELWEVLMIDFIKELHELRSKVSALE